KSSSLKVRRPSSSSEFADMGQFLLVCLLIAGPRAAASAPRLLPLVLYDSAHPTPFSGLDDIEIALRIDPDPVARAVDRAVAPTRETFAVEGQNTDLAAIVLGHVDRVVVVDIEKCRADQLGRPDGQQFAFLVEDLDPIVFAVRDQHTPAAVDPHAMRQVELSRAISRLA